MSVELLDTLMGHEDRVWHAAWSACGRWLATCGGDRTIRIWAPLIPRPRTVTQMVDGVMTKQVHEAPPPSLERWSCVARLKTHLHQRTVRAVAWRHCGRFLVSVAFDASMVLWQRTSDTSNEWTPVIEIEQEGHGAEIKSVAWSPDGSFLATCSRDKRVIVWAFCENPLELEIASDLYGHGQDVKHVAWVDLPAEGESSQCLVSSSYDDTIMVWRLRGDDFECTGVLKGHKSTVWATAALSGSRIASVSDDLSLRIWEPAPSQDLGSPFISKQTISQAHSRPIYSVSHCALPAAIPLDAFVARHAPGQVPPADVVRLGPAIDAAAVGTLAAADDPPQHEGEDVVMGDAGDTGPVAEAPGPASAIIGLVATGAGDNAVGLFAEMDNGTVVPLRRHGRAHSLELNSVAFRPLLRPDLAARIPGLVDPQQVVLATASDDGTIRIWRVSL
ncbi:hypothetical protein H696_02163 [Fonticula alba]|uniref:Probable cytosolic iron-sulfur protein assembly protein CIAO1 homolog n=1 Tax=Fonticula alba TaxID=691883 RepID=A0A058ZCP8_FONAL|nr:hypothetical protein H696_02163 [Fonticula alba]KCV71212.1 hypothetical protein H696_02163 [Fonticula alba]|eukprot:XP_009494335.1 hypothetical protein H696_02163 [Fonticula alba]